MIIGIKQREEQPKINKIFNLIFIQFSICVLKGQFHSAQRQRLGLGIVNADFRTESAT